MVRTGCAASEGGRGVGAPSTVLEVPAMSTDKANSHNGHGDSGTESTQTTDDLTASSISTHAQLQNARFTLARGDVDDIDIRINCDQEVTFSVEATEGTETSTGTLLEFTPEEATAVARRLLRAADEYRND